MRADQEYNYVSWGYALATFMVVMLALALMIPRASISMAQEATATRPAPAPTRPGPGPTRETPVPPTSPPEPTATPGESPAAATATPMPAVMPVTGGTDGGFILLLAGLAFTAAGIGASVGRRRQK